MSAPLSPPPVVSRALALAAYPDGELRATDLEVVDGPVGAPAPDEVLVRNRAFRVSASARGMLDRDARAREGVPYPPTRVGEVLRGAAVGEVVAAGSTSGRTVGETVVHSYGWREYALLPGAQCQPVPASTDPAAVLGYGGTAYAALTRGVRVEAGDTVLVTAGGSAIGSIAGQLARIFGAGRVLATTSTADKARRLVDELGYDAALTRSGPRPLADQLAAVASDGLDVVIDSVGGEQLAIAVRAARPHARFALLGSLAGQLGGGQPVTLDGALLPSRRITLRGYSADDDPDAELEWQARCPEWIADGRLSLAHDVVDGIEHAGKALLGLLAGEYVGVVLVSLTRR